MDEIKPEKKDKVKKEDVFKENVIPKILPVIEQEKDPRIKPVHPNMPQPSALILGLGAIRSGKTTLLNSLLLRPREDGFFGQDYFDNVTLISNTCNADPNFRFLKKAFDVH